MPHPSSRNLDALRRSRLALSRWENEGGSRSNDEPPQSVNTDQAVQELTNAELVQLQIRVIALENILVALLADASDEQLGRVRDIGVAISPRPGVEHRLTSHATAQMAHLARRAMRL